MSSALFGRGTTTQIGAMHRAEQLNRELMEIRGMLTDVQKVPEMVAEMKQQIQEMKARLDAMGVPEIEPLPVVTQEQIEEINNKIEALKLLQTPQVTAGSLQALERRVDAKIAAAVKPSIV
jgi:polyhydroxyalkanoate synthesis regulator phasin